jgi:hypothetical protein
MKKTLIAVLFMFSIILIGCDESTTQEVTPDPDGENPAAEYEAEQGTMEDPGDEAEENSTDGEG